MFELVYFISSSPSWWISFHTHSLSLHCPFHLSPILYSINFSYSHFLVFLFSSCWKSSASLHRVKGRFYTYFQEYVFQNQLLSWRDLGGTRKHLMLMHFPSFKKFELLQESCWFWKCSERNSILENEWMKTFEFIIVDFHHLEEENINVLC